MSHTRWLLFSLVSLIFSTTVIAQSKSGIPTMGTDFYACDVMTKNTCSNTGPYSNEYIVVSSIYDCTVRTYYFDKTGKEVSAGTYNMAAASWKQIPLDRSYVQGDAQGGKQEYCGVHVVTSRPAACKLLVTGPFNTGSALLLPTSLFGVRYVVGTMPNSSVPSSTFAPGCVYRQGSSRFTIVAAYDSTRVVLMPNGTSMAGHIGVRFGDSADGTVRSYSLLLRRGQTYTVRADTNTAINDEAGSIVQSNKPIAVFGTHDLALNNVSRTVFWGQEQRNLLVQEMLPHEYWASRDYLSVSMVDSESVAASNPGAGERVRTVTFDSGNSIRVLSSIGQDTTGQINPFHLFDANNIQGGYSVSSSSGQPFLPFAIDYRLTSPSLIASAPTMLQLVPWQSATNAYTFAVFDDKTLVRKRHYLSVIARADQFSSMTMLTNGVGPKPLSTLPKVGADLSIPGHTELLGRTYEVSPGAYVVSADSNFILYQYGRLSYSLTNDWSEENSSVYCTAYGSAAGMRLRTPASFRPHAYASRTCSGWTLALHSNADAPLAYATVLSDPLGLYVKRTHDSGYVSSNIALASYSMFDTAATITVNFADPSLPATAYIWVVNQAGNDTLLTLRYAGRRVSYNVDSVSFAQTHVQQDTCATVYLRNMGGTGSDTIRVLGLSLKNQHLGASSIKPLPLMLKPGDSLGIRVCFLADTLRAVDTLDVETLCSHVRLPIFASTTHPRIFATDWDFGIVVVGATKVHTVRIWNTGDDNVTLTKDWILHDISRVQFSFVDSAKLPFTLKPGEFLDLNFSFHPITSGFDSTWIDWGTDLKAPFEHADKDYSWLWGLGVAPGLVWSRPQMVFGTWNKLEDTVTLLNPTGEFSGQSVYVDSVTIVGPDAAEFSIIENELNRTPLSDFVLNPQHTVWAKIRWSPDTTVSGATRRDTLIAYDHERRILPIVVLIGKVGLASVARSSDAAGRYFQQRGRMLDCHSNAVPYKLSVRDLLGRDVLEATVPQSGRSIDLNALPSGVYAIIVSTDHDHATTLITLLN